MKSIIQLKAGTSPLLITLALLCFGLLPRAHAVSPAPDGGYPGGNTAEGQSALLSRTTGGYNTAVGFFSLRSDTTGSFNTAIGAGTLFANTGDSNTATGAGALLSNTGGVQNTANGAFALFNETSAGDNTANGYRALYSNTGYANTATGAYALSHNTTGSVNIAVGDGAGINLTTGYYNIDIGNDGFAGEGNTIRIGDDNQGATFIAGIYGVAVSGLTVAMDSSNRLGTVASSRRFKEKIRPMDNVSEAILALEPVSFRYKKEIDPARTSQFGLVAEDVEKVNPDLVVRDKDGKPYSVRYDAVNAMLLNEFLKEHRKVQELEKQVEKLTAGLQKVSAQIEMGKPAAQMAANRR